MSRSRTCYNLSTELLYLFLIKERKKERRDEEDEEDEEEEDKEEQKVRVGTSVSVGRRCSSEVERPLIVRWVVGSIAHGEPIELFLVPASVTRRGMCYPWLGAYKRSVAANRNYNPSRSCSGYVIG